MCIRDSYLGKKKDDDYVYKVVGIVYAASMIFCRHCLIFHLVGDTEATHIVLQNAYFHLVIRVRLSSVMRYCEAGCIKRKCNAYSPLYHVICAFTSRCSVLSIVLRRVSTCATIHSIPRILYLRPQQFLPLI